MKNVIISKKMLIVLLVFSIIVSIFTAYKIYSLKQFIYREYIIFFSDIVLSMQVEFNENEDMSSSQMKEIIYKYDDILNKNSFYKSYSRFDKNFKNLYQNQFSLLLLFGTEQDEYSKKQIDEIRKLVNKITIKTSQNKDIVKIRKKQTSKVNENVYLLFKDIDSMTYEIAKKNQL